MCVHTCAWLCSGLRGQGQLVVLEDFSLGTEKGWQRLGQHREVTGLLTKPHHRDRCFSFFMPLGDRVHPRPTCLYGSAQEPTAKAALPSPNHTGQGKLRLSSLPSSPLARLLSHGLLLTQVRDFSPSILVLGTLVLPSTQG